MADPIRRVAVTGASGYVARGLVRRLEREEAIERVLAIDVRPPAPQPGGKVVFRQLDVRAPLAEALSEHGIEAVAHLAFILKPGRGRAAFEDVNVAGTANVLDSCARAGVRHLLYLSSTTVYGAHADNPEWLTEESPVRPVKGFQYGEHKARAEALIREATGSHSALTATVLRACPVMGPNADNFVSRAFAKPFLVGIRGCDPPMQLLHEDDLWEVMRLCLTQPASGVYNLAGEGTIRWSQMALALDRRLIALPAPILYGLTGATWALRLQSDSPARGLDFIRHRWTASAEKIRRELGVAVRHSSEEAWMAFVRRRMESTPARETGQV